MKLPRQTHLQINTDLRALAQVLAWFEQFNHPAIPRSVWLQCQLALAEGFTNAVRHAHKDQPIETMIDIDIHVSNQSLEIRIWDYGYGFDLDDTLAKLPPAIDQTAEGGRGLKLIQKMADVLKYIPIADHCNCLLIVKNYSSQ